MLTKPKIPKRQMKNKTVVYLAKGEKEQSALLKRRAIADYFGEATIEVTQTGKPIITEPKGYGISVSHSGGVVAVVIAPCDVGLDIEKRKDRDNRRVRSFFHESEKDLEFYSLWVRKEASGKLDGRGIMSQKGKKLDDELIFFDVSKKVSEYVNADFAGVLVSKTPLEVEYKEL